MMTTRRPAGQLFFIIVAIIGVGISMYLTLVHYDHKDVPLVCSTGGFINCENVLSSPYALVPGMGVPISVPGLLWCLVAAGLGLVGWLWRAGDRRVLVAEVVWSGLGVLTALYLVYVELVRLHTLCAWCTALHVLILTLLITSIVQLQGANGEEEWEDEESEEGTLPSMTPERR